MSEINFGANILDNLTTGMYADSRVLFREYIQNACDQIDKARQSGLLKEGEGHVEIDIDPCTRTITIEDNATGIPSDLFVKTLSNIAQSDKKRGVDRGFRGIGRLIGLAYCNELVFESSAKGESSVSILRCDALKMRTLIDENQQGKKHTADDVLRQIYTFSTEPLESRDEEYSDTRGVDSHWFRVKMIGVNKESEELLDAVGIKDYLSFIVPIPYKNTFLFRQKIYEHAKAVGCPIDEYELRVNGEQIFKKYMNEVAMSKGTDKITEVVFKDFRDTEGNLLAWLWYGMTKFEAVIKKDVAMRGIRLRKENIQIGSEDALQKLFKEDRGLHYFVGEVFAISDELIPNSQRDYFNENPTRKEFEKSLKAFFEDLFNTCRVSSDIRAQYRNVEDYLKHKNEIKSRRFIDSNDRKQAFSTLEQERQKAVTSYKKIENIKQKNRNDQSVSSVLQLILDSKGTIDKDELYTPISTSEPVSVEPSNLQTGKTSGTGLSGSNGISTSATQSPEVNDGKGSYVPKQTVTPDGNAPSGGTNPGQTTNPPPKNPEGLLTDVLKGYSPREKMLIQYVYNLIKKYSDDKTSRKLIITINEMLSRGFPK